MFFLLKKFLSTINISIVDRMRMLKRKNGGDLRIEKSILQFHRPVKMARIIHYLRDTLNFLIHTSLFTSVSPDVVINKLWESLLVY